MLPRNDPSQPSQPSPWQSQRFGDDESDPLSGFANIMDVMLAFALGLMLALIAQSQELRHHFKLDQQRVVTEGRELAEPPEAIEQLIQGRLMGCSRWDRFIVTPPPAS